MKYEEPIVPGDNEVHGMILKGMKKGSKVLEFGPAGGRMTKLLAEEYGCKVTIVEREKEAFQSAMRYANDGICADIEDYSWKKWSGAAFDYILFCDVLEHLKNPKQVLKETQDLLKDSGSVFLSLPNIGHNDVLIKLYNHKFAYTEEGLLDDTHIRFFAEDTLENFIKNTGFAMVKKQYKTIATGMTEQYRKEDFLCDDVLWKALQKRVNGDVYQFVLELKKESACVHKDGKMCGPARHMPVSGLIYYDRGDGFSQDDVECMTGTWIQEDTYEFRMDRCLDENVTRIRLDPAERSLCQIISIKCSLGNAHIPHKILFNKKEMIMDMDPQLIWEVPNEEKHVSMQAVIRLDDAGLLNEVLQYGEWMKDKLEILERKNEEYEKHIFDLEQQNIEYTNSMNLLEMQNTKHENYISDLEQENNEYMVRILDLEQKNIEYARSMGLLEMQNTEYEKKILLKDREFHALIHSRSWRYTLIFRKIYAWLMIRRS